MPRCLKDDCSRPQINSRKDERGQWKSKTEFLLSCLGYAIGTGNVWRFPYLCYRNGGGAFLIPYLSMLFLCGIPLFFMETCLGQFSSVGCLTIFRIAPLFKGAGYAIIIVNLICTVYYNIIIAYPVVFIVKSFAKTLPWMHCNNAWNTPYCLEVAHATPNSTGILDADNATVFNRHLYKTPADEYFHREILEIADNIGDIGGIVWPLFWANIFVWIVIYLCIMKGVKSVGKVVYFTATFPFVVLTILFFRGITLPGAITGIKFYIMPKWDQLLNLKVWADAAVQIFFSLGPGWGGIVNMASYNEFKNNSKRDAILVPIVNCSTSIFAGFVVFSVLGFMSHVTGLPVSSVATGGPALAFITYPEAIGMLPFPQFWAIIFFLMLFFLGLDSEFVQIEAIISAVLDEYPRCRAYKSLAAFISCFAMMLVSILFVTRGGMYLLQLFDWYAASISVILVCLCEVIIVGWIYGVKNFIRDIEFMIGNTVPKWWLICWKYITPTILSFIFVTTILFNTELTYNGMEYPRWLIAVGWSSCLVSIVCIPIYFVYKLSKMNGSLKKRIRIALTPNNWGPADVNDRKAWETMIRNSQKNFET